MGRQAGYRILRPRLEGLERPDSVLLSTFAPGRPVTFVYGRGDRIRLLMTQFRGEPLIEKSLVMARKGVRAGTEVQQVTVNGGRGLWLSGEAHSFVFLDRQGEAYQESLRLAQNTLLWEQAGLTVRLEGDLTKEQALEIARSVR